MGWFAAMNYSVHAVMYGYFAITATKYRKVVTPFAIFITLAQLLQMLVGMYVTVKAVLHQTRGDECHVNKTNSVLGLGMYFSYFVLFFKLFVDNYCLNRKGVSSLPRKPSVSEIVRKASEKALDDMSVGVGKRRRQTDKYERKHLKWNLFFACRISAAFYGLLAIRRCRMQLLFWWQ